jgi:hypothetical protein
MIAQFRRGVLSLPQLLKDADPSRCPEQVRDGIDFHQLVILLDRSILCGCHFR